jgi:tRNA (guanine-N7-)-methyltransferase
MEVPPGGPLDLKATFPERIGEVWLEIGAGNGEHAVWQAERNPSIGVIAVEPYINGLSNLLAMVRERDLDNVRVSAGDARLLLGRLTPGSIARVFILFPDPWPKRRHWRRRIVTIELLDALARVMATNGELRIATDHPDYLVAILQLVQSHPRFTWQPRKAEDWRCRPDDWPQTRFEAKGLASNRPPTFLSLRFLGDQLRC